MSEKTQSERVGFVSLKPLPDGRFQCRWWDPASKRYMRRLVPTTSRKEALKSAKEFNSLILGDKGYIPAVRGATGCGVREAVKEAIWFSRASRETKRDYAQRANYFLLWLEEHYPGIVQWGDIRPLHLSAYIQGCEEEDLAFNTIRLRLFPIKMASRHMADNYEEHRDVGRKVRLPERERKPSRPIPNQDTLVALLRFVSEQRPDIWPIMALQSLAGLRVLEALSLRERDIDFESGTIAVAKTSVHTPKNKESERTIPVCISILDGLHFALEHRRVIHDEGFLFMGQGARPLTRSGYSHIVKRLLRQASLDIEDSNLDQLCARDMRATFATLMRSLRSDPRVVKAYMGQRPEDILGKHYEEISEALMREEIVARLASCGVEKRIGDLHQTYIGKSATVEIVELSG